MATELESGDLRADITQLMEGCILTHDDYPDQHLRRLHLAEHR